MLSGGATGLQNFTFSIFDEFDDFDLIDFEFSPVIGNGGYSGAFFNPHLGPPRRQNSFGHGSLF